PELGDRDLHQIGDHFHAAAGAGGALVVHEKVRDLALLVAMDRLAVLAAHEVGAARVAGDFRDRLVRERHVHAPVPRPDHEVNVVERHAALLDHRLDGITRGIGAVAAGAHRAVTKKLAVAHHHRLRRYRADVDAGGNELRVAPVHGLVDPGALFPAPV